MNRSDDVATRADTAARHIAELCSAAPDRRPGSTGNRQATDYAEAELTASGWTTTTQDFDCLDWYSEGGHLTIAGTTIDIAIEPSPYGHGVHTSGPLRIARTPDQLSATNLEGSVLVLSGDLATEPLTPTKYPLYRNEDHTRILDAILMAKPSAVIAITGQHQSAGAIRPFPLIEDGDFPIPTANIAPEHARRLLDHAGEPAEVVIRSVKHPARACNITATKGPQNRRILLIAHIDSKPGTPGAVDNASGVAVLLLVAELLSNAPANPPTGVELLVVNGEDHYAAPGEISWLAEHRDTLRDIDLVINIDGTGYREGTSSYSTYNLDPDIAAHVKATFDQSPVSRGEEWYQSDHAIFAMQGRPAVAITSEPIAEIMATIYHSAADTPNQVDPDQLAHTAAAVATLITTWPTT